MSNIVTQADHIDDDDDDAYHDAEMCGEGGMRIVDVTGTSIIREKGKMNAVKSVFHCSNLPMMSSSESTKHKWKRAKKEKKKKKHFQIGQQGWGVGKQKALRKNEKWKQFAKASSAWL